MKYTATKETSAEILRMVLPLMAKHAAPYHPPNYALWYEYVANINAPLKQAVDKLLAAGCTLDEEKVHELFRAHIADRNEEAFQRLQTEFRRILDDVSHSTQQAGAQAQQYGDTLDKQRERLQGGVDGASLNAIVQTLVAETRQMHGSVATLQRQLAEANREAGDLRCAMQHLRNEALTDPLTGLLNRRGFDEIMGGLLSNGNPKCAETCLIMVDIDHFKRINDTYGHLFGDKVIRTVAQVMKESTKTQGAAARFGGEEFAVLMPGTPLAGARAVAERIRAAIEKGRIRHAGSSEPVGNVTVSLGVTAYREREPVAEFIERADKALYASKQNGRNTVNVHA